MSNKDYIVGRQKYQRPQALLFANNPGTIVNGFYVPDGIEVGSGLATVPENTGEFLILSDHNRSPIDFKINRLEQRQRTINGKMRSFHIADKLTMSISWSMLPSRSFNQTPFFNEIGKTTAEEYTVDGGAGGNELLDWYENHYGSFWVYLAYDKYKNFSSTENPYAHLQQYNQVVEMFISSFDYSVQKRGSTNFDMWNISMTLEEA